MADRPAIPRYPRGSSSSTTRREKPSRTRLAAQKAPRLATVVERDTEGPRGHDAAQSSVVEGRRDTTTDPRSSEGIQWSM